MSSNVEEPGQQDTNAQILINCARSLLKNPSFDEEHLGRLADEYTMAGNTALNLLRNRHVFKTVTQLLDFPHHQNMGRPPVGMFSSWVDQQGHGSVRVLSLSFRWMHR